MRTKMLLLVAVCVGVLTLTAASQVCAAGWQYLRLDHSTWFAPGEPGPVEVLQVEYGWTEAGTIPDPQGTTWPLGSFLYSYTVKNNTSETIKSFGFTNPLVNPGILLVRAIPFASTYGFAPVAATNTNRPYWVADGVGLRPGSGTSGFQIIAKGAPNVWAEADVDRGDGTIIASGLTTAPGPTPPGELGTFTQGGWGAPPRGNNPGALLHANFATVYPGGLVIGDMGSPYTITFTCAQAITDFLPTGGTPGKLSKNYTNPKKKTEAGVFAGQVLALQLNVDFSDAGVLPGGLAGYTLESGPLAGMTVGELLVRANMVLGGDLSALPSGLSISNLNDVVTSVNEMFDEG